MPLTAGKYEGYMRAATFLLDWLLRVHQHLHPAVNVLQLKTLNGAVQQISKNPASLSSDLLHELPNVLKPFHCAIGLREAFAAPLLANDTSKFAALLRIWYNLLQMVPIDNIQDTMAADKNAKTLNGSGNMYSGVRSSPYLATSFDRNIPSVLPCAGNAEAKSILALQGDGGLSRNTDVMFEHARNLSERMEEILTRPTVLSELQTPLSLDKRRDRAHIIERFNPVLA
ncbi:hypothetical protein F442_08903 [Phytophthora nicotianae P10297]|uniref:Uncharacterized protein n=1 Tax=Phytophthora nicotianae P10297 TaxID=1317064 RepID=W2ZBX3_PHYNI|nr:hypothetical protein F442_08903 [Phytophthora nicotianae P10297]